MQVVIFPVLDALGHVIGGVAELFEGSFYC